MPENGNFIISKKINVLIALLLRQISGDKDFSVDSKKKKGVGDIARFLHGMGLDAKDIAEITGAPLGSIRTLLTPKRRK